MAQVDRMLAAILFLSRAGGTGIVVADSLIAKWRTPVKIPVESVDSGESEIEDSAVGREKASAPTRFPELSRLSY